jgi:uncharacterized protein
MSEYSNPGPLAFHVMAKPTGARCNLHCDYCFFLKKESLYPGSNFRMSDDLMEAYLRQTIEGQRVPRVTISWQGGEPTLMGLDFFRRTIEAEKKFARPGLRIENTIQTNGVLLDSEWCRFLHDHRFLVGLSLDGPRHLHDIYRHDKRGQSVFDRVIRAARLMQEHRVEFNILCTVNAANSLQPLEVYRFFRDELEACYIQLIPIVERDNENGNPQGTKVTSRTVDPEQYGRFLTAIFDEWVRRDVGRMFVTFFDAVLAAYLQGASTSCVLRPSCGESVALEHTGDLYSCDHYVEPHYLLGNILQTPIAELISSEKQRRFSRDKSAALPHYCRVCEFLFTCYGECPKNRLLMTPDGQPGLNWLCQGLKTFFGHVDRPMRIMADLLRQGRTADGIMEILAQEKGQPHPAKPKTRRNAPCPCGSGLKFKKCHGRDE